MPDTVLDTFDPAKAGFIIRKTRNGHFQAAFKHDMNDRGRGQIVAQLPAAAEDLVENFLWLVSAAAAYFGVHIYDYLADEHNPVVTDMSVHQKT